MDALDLAAYIDHTNLKPDTTPKEISILCGEACEYKTHAVCVHSSDVKLARGLLDNFIPGGKKIVVCSVVGFPLGKAAFGAKMREAAIAQLCGAREIDMVINIGRLKCNDRMHVEAEIAKVVGVTTECETKVILETCYLTDEEIATACRMAENAGAHFVKTSTGFGPKGATVEHVKLMRNSVSEDLGIKAAGGIKTYADAIAMIDAGASRLGLSRTVEILKECEHSQNLAL